MVVTQSHTGYIKSQPLSEYRAQRRGGRGKQATSMKADDWIDQLFIANTHDHILCFSDRGRVYWLKVWEVPQGGRARRIQSRRAESCARSDLDVFVDTDYAGCFHTRRSTSALR